LIDFIKVFFTGELPLLNARFPSYPAILSIIKSLPRLPSIFL
jgi:hypothetical protein